MQNSNSCFFEFKPWPNQNWQNVPCGLSFQKCICLWFLNLRNYFLKNKMFELEIQNWVTYMWVPLVSVTFFLPLPPLLAGCVAVERWLSCWHNRFLSFPTMRNASLFPCPLLFIPSHQPPFKPLLLPPRAATFIVASWARCRHHSSIVGHLGPIRPHQHHHLPNHSIVAAVASRPMPV